MSRLFRPCLVEDRERLDFEWLIRRLVADLGLRATTSSDWLLTGLRGSLLTA